MMCFKSIFLFECLPTVVTGVQSCCGVGELMSFQTAQFHKTFVTRITFEHVILRVHGPFMMF